MNLPKKFCEFQHPARLKHRNGLREEVMGEDNWVVLCCKITFYILLL